MLFVAPEFLDEEWGCHDDVAFYIIVRMELFSEGEDPLLKGVKSELEKSSFVVVRVGFPDKRKLSFAVEDTRRLACHHLEMD